MTTESLNIKNDLISIEEAAASGIKRLKKPIWQSEYAHIELEIFDKTLGAWIKFYDPLNKMINGRDPVELSCLTLELSARAWEPYEGPAGGSKEYKLEQEKLKSLTL